MHWLGVDVGGTFTDLVMLDEESGEVRVAKRPSTPVRPDEGVLAAVEVACPDDELQAARYFIHGTTVGLNALLEHDQRGLGLLTTRGFRDVLEIRRGNRGEPYDLFWRPPEPLVPRRLRLEISERMGADGRPVVPLDRDDVRAAATRLAEAEVDSVAIVFLHAYANPEHELQALAELRAAGFTGQVSLSHLTSGEFREYERTCTTVIDACVRREVGPYLQRLTKRLQSAGFAGDTLITRSGGGAMTVEEAEARPFETILSGPVAGVEGAATLAAELGLDAVVTADVGGTSFDTALIVAQRPQQLYEGSVNGLPVQSPWVDVRSIGAGGGSIAHVDVGGLMRVGPRSAGADPGPACYGDGGEEPTVTDAMLTLGMLGRGVLANGKVLDRVRAESAIAPLADVLGMSVDGVARGIVEIAAASMANVIGEVTIDQGEDPRQAVLMAFGGAGPLFATLIARQLGMAGVVVPRHAGNFSAHGLLVADLVRSAARTRIGPVSEDTLAEGNDTLAQLFRGLAKRPLQTGRQVPTPGDADGRDESREVALDMRYVGQDHAITVELPCSLEGRLELSAPSLLEQFARQYEKTYGSTMEEVVEIITWRATVRTRLSRRGPERPATAANDTDGGAPQTLPAYSFAAGSVRQFAIVERDSLQPRDRLEGPAIILEQTATTYLDSGFQLRVNDSGALSITCREERP